MSSQPWTLKNRLARALANADVRTGPSPAGGRGLFTTRPLAPGDPVCSYHGIEVSRARLAELHSEDRALFERISEYGVSTTRGGHLYAPDLSTVGAHLINHSCAPNVRWAEWERGALVVRALKAIPANEELAIHYGWLGVKAAHDRAWHECRCRARLCAGTIELRLEFLEDPEDRSTVGTSLPVEEAAVRGRGGGESSMTSRDPARSRPSHHDLRASTERYKKHNDGVVVSLETEPSFSLQELNARARRRARALAVCRLLTKSVDPDRQRALTDLVFAAIEYAQRGDSDGDLRSAAVQFAEAFKEEP